MVSPGAAGRCVKPSPLAAHFDRVGVAEQVVDVAEDFLVRADHEEAEAVALARAQARAAAARYRGPRSRRRCRSCRRSRRSGRRSRRAASAASSRRSIGMIGNTWSIAHTSGIDSNTQKLTKYLSTSRSLSSSSRSRWLLLVVGQARLHRVGDGVEQVVDARALDQVDLARARTATGLRRGVLGLVEELDRGTPASSSCSSRRWRTGCDSSSCASGTRPSGARSTSDTLATSTAWCAVIARPHSVTMRGGGQAVSAQASASGCTMLRGVLVEAVVDRAVAARARAFVVDAEAAADIDMADVGAELATVRRSSGSPRACRWRCRARWRSASPCGSAAA